MCNLNLLANMASIELNKKKIEHEIANKLHLLSGEVITKRSSYEKALGEFLGWRCSNHTDYDLMYDELEIEVKKAQNVSWMNLMRYRDPKHENNFTLFLYYNKKHEKIVDYYVVHTNFLREKLFENIENTAMDNFNLKTQILVPITKSFVRNLT